MLLATTQVEDLDRFLEVFSTDGADKRNERPVEPLVMVVSARDPGSAETTLRRALHGGR